MKKNGKKYRKLQKEKERKKNQSNHPSTKICQEVDGINTASLAMAHIITYNPIIKDSAAHKAEYLKKLNAYLKAVKWNRRKYESAEMEAYEKIIMGATDVEECHDMPYYQYYILFDFMNMLAYDFKPVDLEKLQIVKEQYCVDFANSIDMAVVDKIFKAAAQPARKVKQLLKEPKLTKENEYIQLIQKNIQFKKKEPVAVMVTATMSAGKSTFINALAGKYICLSQNLACTSKIHCIVNKAFEDGFSAEYDHELVLTAEKEELLNDNELNTSDKIVVSTSFTGGLAGQRLIINDSPGVNYSGDERHKQVTERLLKGKNYHLLLYIMNGTQLGTNDESEHLDYVKKHVGKIPILFIINKIDEFNEDEEDIEAVIKRQIKMLEQKGFHDPVVCPVSARAGYLAKQFKVNKLSRSEERELYNYVDKFEKMKLTSYYDREFQNIKVADAENEEAQLLKTCGLAYVEKMIIAMCKGENENGSGKRTL